MPEESRTPSTFRFGPFELWVETGELRKNGVRLGLRGQPIKVLTLLIETPRKLVTREELQRQLWPGSEYGDFEAGLNAAVNRLRQFLIDSATEPTYIETIPGRGYRFIGALQSSDRVEDPKPSSRSLPVLVEDDPIAFLKVVRGPDLDRSFALTRSMTHLLIGRSSDCDIVLEDRYSSRLHVTLTIESLHTDQENPVQYVFTLICTGLNGVVVEGKEGKKVVHRLELRHGDCFRLAYNTFRFVVPDQDAVNRSRAHPGDSATEPKYIETVPGRGYRFIGQPESETSLPNSEPASPIVAPTPVRLRRILTRAILVVVSLAVVLSVAWLARKTMRNPEPTLTAVPLTALPGNAIWPSFSPDGQQIAFAWDKNLGGPPTDFFVQSIGGSGPPLQLTHTGLPFLASALTAWSPDGKWITYQRHNPKPNQRPIEIVITPAPVGGPELVLQRTNFAQCGLSWSPDGKYLAFSDRDLPKEPYAIFLLERNNLERRRVTTPPSGVSGGDAFAAFSHDGKRIAFVRDLNGATQVAVLELPSGSIQILASGPGTILGSLAWSPSDADIIYGSDVSGSWRLWRVASAGGDPRPLSIGEDGWAPAVSAPAHRLAYGRGASDSNIWRIRFGEDKGETRGELIASSRQDFQPEFSPDENNIVFTSDRSGSSEIWVTDRDGNNPIQITRLGNSSTGSPRWSPDGKLVAFDSRARGKSEIYLVGLDGATPRLIANDDFDDSRPSWSADGKWIYYQSNRSGEMQVWKVSARGGQATQITKHGGSFAFETSNAKILYYIIAKQDSELWRLNLQDGEEHRIAEAPDIPDYLGYQITDDGIYFATPDITGSVAHSTLRYFSFGTKKTQTVGRLGNMTWTYGISISKDGRTILYSQQDHMNMNIMLVENFH